MDKLNDKSVPIKELVSKAQEFASLHTVYVIDADKIQSLEDVKRIFKSLTMLIKPTNPNFELLSDLVTEKKEYDGKNTKA